MFKLKALLLSAFTTFALLGSLYAGATPGAPPASASSSNGTNLPLPLGATNYIQANPAAAQAQGFNVGGSTVTGNLVVTGLLTQFGPAITRATETVKYYITQPDGVSITTVTFSTNGFITVAFGGEERTVLFSTAGVIGGAGGMVSTDSPTVTGQWTFENSTTSVSGSTFFKRDDGALQIRNKLYTNSGFQSSSTIRGGAVLMGEGVAYSAPDLRSANDGDTGIHWNSGNSISIGAGGQARFTVDTTTATMSGNMQITAPAGYDRHILQVTTGTTRLFEVYGTSVVSRVPFTASLPQGQDERFRPKWIASMLSISETEKFVKENHYLPGFMPEEQWAKSDVGTLLAGTLGELEEAYLHIFDLNRRVRALYGAAAALIVWVGILTVLVCRKK